MWFGMGLLDSRIVEEDISTILAMPQSAHKDDLRDYYIILGRYYLVHAFVVSTESVQQ